MITTFGTVDERSKQQLTTCLQAAEEREGQELQGVLCADHHPGYSQPIGGIVAYEHHVSPSGVGYDIACGNLASKTNVRASDVDVARVMDEVWNRISFGIGRNNDAKVDDPVLDKIAHASESGQRRLAQMAANQLGTVGSGNHYVDLFEDEEGWLWVGVHFGSRGFGHRTASGFLALAQGAEFTDRVPEPGMDSLPTLLDARAPLGQSYLEAMTLAGEYAYAGREWVVDTVVRDILEAQRIDSVHNHHNFAWREMHGGREWWVIRKGATPAFPGQRGFVGSSMGDISVVLEGVESERSAASLYSTVHGAGRVMSRSEAAGRVKIRTVWACGQRGCSGTLPIQTPLGKDGSNPKCPVCAAKTHRGQQREVKRKGRVDWHAVQEKIAAKGIVLRGAGADEAPEVYKRLPDVLAAHEGTIKILHTLKPLGVAMAGIDTVDPFKD